MKRFCYDITGDELGATVKQEELHLLVKSITIKDNELRMIFLMTLKLQYQYMTTAAAAAAAAAAVTLTLRDLHLVRLFFQRFLDV